jgi:hypothetical protein
MTRRFAGSCVRQVRPAPPLCGEAQTQTRRRGITSLVRDPRRNDDGCDFVKLRHKLTDKTEDA